MTELRPALRKVWRKPRLLPLLLFQLYARSRRRDPMRWRRLLARRFLYSNHRKIARRCEELGGSTRSVYEGAVVRGPGGDRGTALVVILRSFWPIHVYHHYLLACALKREGYRVVIVRCRGHAENCGSGETESLLDAPPYRCRACLAVSESLYDEPFEVAYLDDYADPCETSWVEGEAMDPTRDVRDLALGDLPYGRLSMPFLLRFLEGDPARITLRRFEVRQQLRGSLRLALRYRKLLADHKPSCAVLFNGLFVPERLFSHLNDVEGVSTLFTERGPRPNSLFVSDRAAPHYRMDDLWQRERHRIGTSEIQTAARYVESRRHRNVDPAGRPRAIQVGDLAEYEKLAETRYTVFFPPIFHDTVSMEKESCFEGIFDAIEQLVQSARRQRARLVIRCHPDESDRLRRNPYSVQHFLRDRGLLPSEHVVCLEGSEPWNAYLLAENAASVVIYNGSLGMELPALGIRIFNLARSHYTEKGFTSEIRRPEDLASIFTEDAPPLSVAEREIALKYLWFYYFRASLDVGSLVNEYEPFRLEFATVGAAPEAKGALDAIRRRVSFLLHRDPDEPGSSPLGG